MCIIIIPSRTFLCVHDAPHVSHVYTYVYTCLVGTPFAVRHSTKIDRRHTKQCCTDKYLPTVRTVESGKKSW